MQHKRVTIFGAIRQLFQPPPKAPTFTESIRNSLTRVFGDRHAVEQRRPLPAWRQPPQILEDEDSVWSLSYLWSGLTSRLGEICLADLVTVCFFMFGLYVAYQFYRKEGIFSTTRTDVDAIPSEHLQKHIQNVSTLIDRMHESHSQITKRMWELQVPLTMVKYRTKMMDEVFADAAGDTPLPIFPEMSKRNVNADNIPR